MSDAEKSDDGVKLTGDSDKQSMKDSQSSAAEWYLQKFIFYY